MVLLGFCYWQDFVLDTRHHKSLQILKKEHLVIDNVSCQRCAAEREDLKLLCPEQRAWKVEHCRCVAFVFENNKLASDLLGFDIVSGHASSWYDLS